MPVFKLSGDWHNFGTVGVPKNAKYCSTTQAIAIANRLNLLGNFGAAGGDRTHDPWLRRPILYPLSYSREGRSEVTRRIQFLSPCVHEKCRIRQDCRILSLVWSIIGRLARFAFKHAKVVFGTPSALKLVIRKS